MVLMHSMYFVAVTLHFQLLAKNSSAALPCKRFVNKRSYTRKQFGHSLAIHQQSWKKE